MGLNQCRQRAQYLRRDTPGQGSHSTRAISGEIFSWLLERREDALGNVITFEYVAEDLANVSASPFEQHRLAGTASIANTYLKTISYGNQAPGDDSRFAFRIVFDYGDHDVEAPTPTPLPGAWPARRDAFSSYRAGFEIRTYRRCRRILVFHDLSEQGAAPRLVRSIDLTYDDDAALTHLIADHAARLR